MIQVTNTIVLDEREVTERFVRSTGPGGQNLNRDATAVELRLDIGRSSLPRDVQVRLIALAGRHVTTGDVLVVVAERTDHKCRIVAPRVPGLWRF